MILGIMCLFMPHSLLNFRIKATPPTCFRPSHVQLVFFFFFNSYFCAIKVLFFHISSALKRFIQHRKMYGKCLIGTRKHD